MFRGFFSFLLRFHMFSSGLTLCITPISNRKARRNVQMSQANSLEGGFKRLKVPFLFKGYQSTFAIFDLKQTNVN